MDSNHRRPEGQQIYSLPQLPLCHRRLENQTGAACWDRTSDLLLTKQTHSHCANTAYRVLSVTLSLTVLAEGEGFEPSEPFRVQRLSRAPQSTALSPFLGCLVVFKFGQRGDDCVKLFFMSLVMFTERIDMAPDSHPLSDHNDRQQH